MYKICVVILAAMVAMSNGVQPTNYDISRNQLGGFGIRDIVDYLLGGGYGPYNPGYPSGSGYYPGGHHPGGQYPVSNYPGSNYPGSNYPGSNYPGGHYPGPAGPPGAHPGCPLCDSSVYSYCSYKQANDACCCGTSGYYGLGCQKGKCNLYANSCQEHELITNCCCVDLFKNNQQAQPIAVVA